MPIAKIEKLKENLFYSLWEISEQESLDTRLFPELERIRHASRRRESLAARMALLALLEEKKVEFRGLVVNENRKPFLKGGAGHISLTHGGQWAASAFYSQGPVGMDIEKISEKPVRVAERFCSEAELEYAAGRKEYLTTLWTIKEAVYKWYGLGGVDFQKHILVPGFQFEPTGGELDVMLDFKQLKIQLKICYFQVGDAILTVCYQA
ncbi:4'-phosphopantetheinyl transferase superfamily protein [Persicobacter sp. CCB-QB2]|uniref:4'-phosphopantetheinyl transferase family protein n=1 Tax=Persicobacter sp. CCB-QB2 TaxID=1561025 RepID=UPI0006A9A5DE|nr:4'-phosphopantetheinyl transferase superfamily protein [Persicobacter sp. CCB-QB2]